MRKSRARRRWRSISGRRSPICRLTVHGECFRGKAAKGISWHVCAEKVKADYLITRDEKGFRNASIPHGTASEFMEFVFQKTNVRYAIEKSM